MISLVPMISTLQADKSQVELKKIMGTVLEHQNKLKRQSQQGLPPDDFKTINAVIDACDIAIKTVENAWKFYQKNKNH